MINALRNFYLNSFLYDKKISKTFTGQKVMRLLSNIFLDYSMGKKMFLFTILVQTFLDSQMEDGLLTKL